MSRAAVARLEVLAAALLFSTGGAAIKASELSGFQVAGFRSAVAVVTLLLALPESRRRPTAAAAGIGAVYAATMVLFVVANKLTTAANTIFLQYTSPVWIVLLGPWLLAEPIRPRDLKLLAVLALGLGLFFLDGDRGIASAPRPALGNVLAVLSGVFWAGTAIGLRFLARDSRGATSAVVHGNAIAFLACLPLSLPVVGADAGDLAAVVYLGVFQISGAYFFLTRALRDVPALEASLLLLLEPVLSPLWAWLLHGEAPGPWALAGAAVVLAATAAKTVADTRVRPPVAV